MFAISAYIPNLSFSKAVSAKKPSQMVGPIAFNFINFDVFKNLGLRNQHGPCPSFDYWPRRPSCDAL